MKWYGEICPLKFNSKTLDADGNVKEECCKCEKEYCAWWIKEYVGEGKHKGYCAIKLIAERR
ncbi:MAG: hypothetical protein J7K20_02030 [Thermodesulfobacterium sp.]|nr:hypothetical protein [Thermodesulfobacterium sp.]